MNVLISFTLFEKDISSNLLSLKSIDLSNVHF